MTLLLLILLLLLALWCHWLHRLVDYRGDCIHALQDERDRIDKELRAIRENIELIEADLMLTPRQDIRRRA